MGAVYTCSMEVQYRHQQAWTYFPPPAAYLSPTMLVQPPELRIWARERPGMVLRTKDASQFLYW
jgi:hypothetical protein